jgi:hypothetical protein
MFIPRTIKNPLTDCGKMFPFNVEACGTYNNYHAIKG